MFKSNRVLALDIGASKMVLAEFAVRKAMAPELINYGIGSIDIEPESGADASAFIVSTIREVMAKSSIKAGPMMMTVSGQAVFPRYVKLPPVASDKLLQIIRYEAEQNVPFPIDEVVWDYQLIGGGEDGGLNVMLVAVKKENVSHLTDCVQAAGLEPEVVDVAPMALYNAVRFNYPDLAGCTMILDVGARSSNLIFIEGTKIFSRSIPVAGNAITQEVAKECELSFKEAEKLKQVHAFVALGGVFAGAEDGTANRVSKIVRNVITRLHAEVNRSINFYRSQQGGNPPSLVLLTGGSSVIPHMDTFFREKLKVEVEYLNPFLNVPVSDNLESGRVEKDVHLLGEVVGLALRRSLTCPVEINLMPPELESRKVFRRRQPYFVIAAIGIAAIMLCWWIYLRRMRTVTDSRMSLVEARIERLRGVSGELDKVKAGKMEAVSRFDSFFSVIKMRTQWIEILKEIHSRLLEGMWLTGIQPIVEKEMLEFIEISGMGFVDKLVDAPDASAIEQFNDTLREAECFGEETRIIMQREAGSEGFAREFIIRIELKKPISLAGRPGIEGERKE